MLRCTRSSRSRRRPTSTKRDTSLLPDTPRGHEGRRCRCCRCADGRGPSRGPAHRGDGCVSRSEAAEWEAAEALCLPGDIARHSTLSGASQGVRRTTNSSVRTRTLGDHRVGRRSESHRRGLALPVIDPSDAAELLSLDSRMRTREDWDLEGGSDVGGAGRRARFGGDRRRCERSTRRCEQARSASRGSWPGPRVGPRRSRRRARWRCASPTPQRRHRVRHDDLWPVALRRPQAVRPLVADMVEFTEQSRRHGIGTSQRPDCSSLSTSRETTTVSSVRWRLSASVIVCPDPGDASNRASVRAGRQWLRVGRSRRCHGGGRAGE